MEAYMRLLCELGRTTGTQALDYCMSSFTLTLKWCLFFGRSVRWSSDHKPALRISFEMISDLDFPLNLSELSKPARNLKSVLKTWLCWDYTRILYIWDNCCMGLKMVWDDHYTSCWLHGIITTWDFEYMDWKSTANCIPFPLPAATGRMDGGPRTEGGQMLDARIWQTKDRQTDGLRTERKSWTDQPTVPKVGAADFCKFSWFIEYMFRTSSLSL